MKFLHSVLVALSCAYICLATENVVENKSVSKGKYLFYFPFVTMSMKITIVPLVHAMADRGHSVTVLIPEHSGNIKIDKHQDIKILQFKDDFDEQVPDLFLVDF